MKLSKFQVFIIAHNQSIVFHIKTSKFRNPWGHMIVTAHHSGGITGTYRTETGSIGIVTTAGDDKVEVCNADSSQRFVNRMIR